jgi:hypothetical protein
MKSSLITGLAVGILLGLLIAYVDTSPRWDDTGISVIMLLVASLVCGAISLNKTWLIALSVGVWVPLFNIVSHQNYGSLIALIPAFVGAYIGSFLRKAFQNA